MVVGPQSEVWQDCTDYRKSWFVDAHHPQADDNNEGSKGTPLRTIQAAVDRLQAGEEVVIASSLYREAITIDQGGTACDCMVRLRAADNADVIISGAEPLVGTWHQPLPEGAANNSGKKTGNALGLSQRTWVCDLDPIHLSQSPTNWQLANVNAHDESLMPWMEPVSGMASFDLCRCMLFQGDQRLVQLSSANDVARVPGSFAVHLSRHQLVVHPLNLAIGQQPNTNDFEIAVRPVGIAADGPGVDYVSIQGLHVTRIANGFLRTSTGAICNRAGSHWRIEHCELSEINSSGIECSDVACEPADKDNPWRKRRGAGHCIIAHSNIHDCGTAGIRSHYVNHGYVCYNRIHHCGWQEAEYYFECAAIKLLVTQHTLVMGNHISHIQGGCGIWMDWKNKYSRVTENIIHDIEGMQGGIFLEASVVPNIVDHNLIWRTSGIGIFGGDSQNQIYEHNIIGHSHAAAVLLFCHTDRKIHGVPTQCINNLVRRNMVFESVAFDVQEEPNFLEDNVIVKADSVNQMSLDDATYTWSFEVSLPALCGPPWFSGQNGSVNLQVFEAVPQITHN
jgi:hypothetical protein